MRVLVAEDDPGLREVLVMGLEDHGYQVDAASAATTPSTCSSSTTTTSPSSTGACPVLRDRGRGVGSQARQTNAILMLNRPRRPTGPDPRPRRGRRRLPGQALRLRELLARIRALQRRPRGVDAPIIARGSLALDPVRREFTVAVVHWR